MKVVEKPNLWRFALFVLIAISLVAYVMRQRPTIDTASMQDPTEITVPGGSIPTATGRGEPAVTIRPDALSDARLTRDRARSQEMEGLATLAENHKLADEARAEAGQQLVDLTQRTAREMEAEALLLARGYAEAVVFVHSHTAEVIVRTDTELTTAQAHAMADVVANATGVPIQHVKVVPRP